MSGHCRALLILALEPPLCSPASRVPSPRCVARAALQPYVLHGRASPAPPWVGPCPPPCLVPRWACAAPLLVGWPSRPGPAEPLPSSTLEQLQQYVNKMKVEDDIFTSLPLIVLSPPFCRFKSDLSRSSCVRFMSSCSMQ
jgi:hypothetical protein